VKQKTKGNIKPTYEFEISVVEHCNLNCAYCSHYSPLAQEGYLSPEALVKDLKRIYEISGNRIERVKILGGEPTLHPRLNEILAAARQSVGDTPILLFTNGLLLDKMPDSFWETLRDEQIGIISDKYGYKGFDEYKLAAIAARHRITLWWTSSESKRMDYFPLDLTGSQNLKQNFEGCFFRGHNQLRDGKFYCCTTPPNVFHFNNYFGADLSVCEKDYIDIYGDITHEDILEYLSNPVPFCRYCDKNRIIRERKWKLSKRDMGEWS